jgi:hypothetical protein
MRKIIMVLIGLAAFALLVDEAAAATISVKITQQQVANVCGKNMQTGGGHSGCTKTCGLQKEHYCDFDCNNKTGNCTGTCVTCQARKFPFGKHYPIRVINQSLKASL